MPTITIQLSNDDEVGDLITNVLRYCSNPIITIDTCEADPATPLTTAATRVATNAKALAEQYHPVIDSVMSASTRKRATKAAKRQSNASLKAWTRTNWDSLISVPCRACGAKVNESCHSPGGNMYGTGFVHNDRLQARARRIAGDDMLTLADEAGGAR